MSPPMPPNERDSRLPLGTTGICILDKKKAEARNPAPN